MQGFEYNASSARVLFGLGSSQKLAGEVKRLSLTKPMLISTPTQQSKVEGLAKILDNDSVTVASVYSKASMHTPTSITEEAVEQAKNCNADSIISFGGGSAIGLGKAISVRTGLYHISIPTTYAGSEMTPILGETKNGHKVTRSDPAILPRTVIYDVSYTLDLSVEMSTVSGINAVAHAGTSILVPVL